MTQLPHVLKRIRLNLARSKEFPLGSDRCGYELVAPLDARGHIDVELWRKHREHCGVRRFWEGQDDQVGRLVHQPGGPEHGRWAFDYDDSPEGDDEAGYRFAHHLFRPGEYVDPGRRRRIAHLSGGLGRTRDMRVSATEARDLSANGKHSPQANGAPPGNTCGCI
jgi:hypothetical protein